MGLLAGWPWGLASTVLKAAGLLSGVGTGPPTIIPEPGGRRAW